MLVRERLKALIDEKCRGNQSELARRIGEHPNWVNWRVNGTTQIKADELPKIAEALGCSPCDFFEPSPNERMNQAMRDELARTRAVQAGPDPSATSLDYGQQLATEIGPTARTPGRPSPADKVAAELTWGWDLLPEEEQEFLTDLAAVTQRLRERIAMREGRAQGRRSSDQKGVSDAQ